jgi:flagellar motility protein MotE (MotC chaperone)
MYRKQIAALEQDLRKLEEDIKQGWSTELSERRKKILNSLSALRRRQYEYENEYVDNSDDDR